MSPPYFYSNMKTLDILKNNIQNPSKDYKRVDTGFVVNREEIILKKIKSPNS